MTTSLVRPFAIISGAQVHRALDSARSRSWSSRTAQPPRIITQPASLGGTFQVDGLKWTSSFSGNVALRTPRASAVLIVGNFFHDLRRYG